jgi:hypothetical protein
MTSAREWERRIKRLARHTPQSPDVMAVLEQAGQEQSAGDLALARMRGQLPYGAPGCNEDVEHRALVLWVVREGLVQWPDLAYLHHSPNEAAYRGQQGKLVSAGYPDFVLPVRASGYIGLVLELKAPGGTVAKDQWRWLGHFERQGWATGTPFGYEPARDLLIAYLSGNL